MPTKISLAAVAALFACLLSGEAYAHAVLDKTQASPGRSYRGAIVITHGCQGSPTISVRLTIPEGVVLAKAMAKPGWTISSVNGDYARRYRAFHGEVSSGSKEIDWTGGPPLPDSQFDEFVFSALIADTFKPGDVIPFPVVQTCEQGASRWTEVPGPGQSAHDLTRPAPALTLVAADEAPPVPAVFNAGQLRIEAPTIRATPNGAKVAAGYVQITNTGSTPDTLLGGTVPFARRVEVHEMTTSEGIMKMRPLTDGLVIAPGATIELKPGGAHLMFEDLTMGATQGTTIAGALHFARAGDVPVTFTVTGLGGPASGPPPEHMAH